MSEWDAGVRGQTAGEGERQQALPHATHSGSSSLRGPHEVEERHTVQLCRSQGRKSSDDYSILSISCENRSG